MGFVDQTGSLLKLKGGTINNYAGATSVNWDSPKPTGISGHPAYVGTLVSRPSPELLQSATSGTLSRPGSSGGLVAGAATKSQALGTPPVIAGRGE